jgi:hypothetical protein
MTNLILPRGICSAIIAAQQGVSILLLSPKDWSSTGGTPESDKNE